MFQGQYDIKKLKRENEMLKKEIWCLRDEYDKLDKLLKEKEYEFSSSSTTCSTSDSVSPRNFDFFPKNKLLGKLQYM